MGPFINADNIEVNLRETGRFDVGAWNIQSSAEEMRDFFVNSWVVNKRPQWIAEVGSMLFSESWVDAGNISINSYVATVVADFLREKLLEQKASFTFETVMSEHSKIRF